MRDSTGRRSGQSDCELPWGEAPQRQPRIDTDPDARLARKGNGQEAKLSYCGNVMIENRNGLVVDTELLQANGTAERDAALLMMERIPGANRVTVAGDKGYDTKDFVAELRQMNVTPHVAQNAYANSTERH